MFEHGNIDQVLIVANLLELDHVGSLISPLNCVFHIPDTSAAAHQEIASAEDVFRSRELNMNVEVLRRVLAPG